MSAGDRSGEETGVVTCFVLRAQAGQVEVLLARRSQRVRTYRGAWGGISGYLEPGVGPLQQAVGRDGVGRVVSEQLPGRLVGVPVGQRLVHLVHPDLLRPHPVRIELDAHGVGVDLESDPPKMGPPVALVAEPARALAPTKHGSPHR